MLPIFASTPNNPNADYRTQAHYDGQHIVLDEPFDLPANTSLMVTVLPAAADESEDTWLRVAAANDAFSFLADPAEDIYTAADGEPFRDAV